MANREYEPIPDATDMDWDYDERNDGTEFCTECRAYDSLIDGLCPQCAKVEEYDKPYAYIN